MCICKMTSSNKKHFLNASFSDEVVFTVRALFDFLFRFFLPSHVFLLSHVFLTPVGDRGRKCKGEGTWQCIESLFLLHWNRKFLLLMQCHLKTKRKKFTREEQRKKKKIEKKKGKKKSKAENSCFLWFFLSQMNRANSSVTVGGDGWGADRARGMEWVYESALAAYRGRNSDFLPNFRLLKAVGFLWAARIQPSVLQEPRMWWHRAECWWEQLEARCADGEGCWKHYQQQSALIQHFQFLHFYLELGKQLLPNTSERGKSRKQGMHPITSAPCFTPRVRWSFSPLEFC